MNNDNLTRSRRSSDRKMATMYYVILPFQQNFTEVCDHDDVLTRVTIFRRLFRHETGFELGSLIDFQAVLSKPKMQPKIEWTGHM